MNDESTQTVEPVKLLLLDKERMATAICVSVPTLDDMRKRGCPCVPVPGARRVLFDPDEVIQWLKGQREPQEDARALAAAKARADVVFGKRTA